MKKGISYWSFAGGFGENKAVYADVFREARRHGFQAVEACIDTQGELTFDTPRSRCEQIAAAAKAAGVEISSVATGVFWGVPPTSDKPAERKAALAYLKKMVQRAAWLGTGAVLFVPGAVAPAFVPGTRPVDYDVALKRAAACIRGALPTAKKHRVAICIENVWNQMLLSPLEMKGFIDQFKSPWVKCYLDLSNALLCGHPQHWIKILGKRRLGRIHTKDFCWKPMFLGGEKGREKKLLADIRKIAPGSVWAGCYAFCDIGAGSTDWSAVKSALRDAGYDGYVTAEMIPPVDPKTGKYDRKLLARTSKALDKYLFS